jgi:hypothetical protein
VFISYTLRYYLICSFPICRMSWKPETFAPEVRPLLNDEKNCHIVCYYTDQFDGVNLFYWSLKINSSMIKKMQKRQFSPGFQVLANVKQKDIALDARTDRYMPRVVTEEKDILALKIDEEMQCVFQQFARRTEDQLTYER